MKKNAILFSKVDQEDYWVGGGIVFKTDKTSAYKDAYNELKEKLEDPELINHIIEDRCLMDDYFEGDETYKFIKTYWAYALFYVFENSEGNQVEYKLTADYVNCF